MEDTANSYGIGFAQKFPALSAKLAGITAAKTGLTPTDPANVAAAMHSNVFQTEAGKAASATDTAAIDRVFSPPKFAPDTASVEDQTKAAMDVRENAVSSLMPVKRSLYEAGSEAAAQLGELSAFNRDDYKAARLKELNPTKDLDQRALELRMQAFTAASMLETDPEIMALPPALQQRAIASKQQVFSDAIQSIAKLRAARLESAEAQIDQELSGKERQINTAKFRVDAIDRQIKQLEDIGSDQDTIASLRLDRIKEMERLRKGRAGAGGMTTQKEFVYDALVKDFRANHADRIPDANEEQELKRQTEMIVKHDPATAAAITSPDQTYRGFRGGAVQPPEDRLGPGAAAIRLKGYGLPLSEAEQSKLDEAAANVKIAQGKIRK